MALVEVCQRRRRAEGRHACAKWRWPGCWRRARDRDRFPARPSCTGLEENLGAVEISLRRRVNLHEIDGRVRRRSSLEGRAVCPTPPRGDDGTLGAHLPLRLRRRNSRAARNIPRWGGGGGRHRARHAPGACGGNRLPGTRGPSASPHANTPGRGSSACRARPAGSRSRPSAACP
jgi:hypothetical protein